MVFFVYSSWSVEGITYSSGIQQMDDDKDLEFPLRRRKGASTAKHDTTRDTALPLLSATELVEMGKSIPLAFLPSTDLKWLLQVEPSLAPSALKDAPKTGENRLHYFLRAVDADPKNAEARLLASIEETDFYSSGSLYKRLEHARVGLDLIDTGESSVAVSPALCAVVWRFIAKNCSAVLRTHAQVPFPEHYTPIYCNVRAVEAMPMSEIGWCNLGVVLGMANPHTTEIARSALAATRRHEAIDERSSNSRTQVNHLDCFITAISINDAHPLIWFNLGFGLHSGDGEDPCVRGTMEILGQKWNALRCYRRGLALQYCDPTRASDLLFRAMNFLLEPLETVYITTEDAAPLRYAGEIFVESTGTQNTVLATFRQGSGLQNGTVRVPNSDLFGVPSQRARALESSAAGKMAYSFP